MRDFAFLGPDSVRACPATCRAARARSTGPPPTSTRRSRSSTSTPSTRTPPRWPTGPPASRCGWRASRCAAGRCSSRVLARPGWRGVMAYTLAEALWLVRTGVDRRRRWSPTRPPTAPRWPAGRRRAARRGRHPHGRRARRSSTSSTRSSPPAGAAPLRVCLDLDASWRPLGGRLHVGVRRSPVHSPRRPARSPPVAARPGFRLVGLMSYEAQIAGLGDAPPGRPSGAPPSGRCSAARTSTCCRGAAPPWPRSARRLGRRD